ncbi:MAG: hypothetical protein ACI910_003113 [Oleispira sp.]|jgi:hypothetical protein
MGICLSRSCYECQVLYSARDLYARVSIALRSRACARTLQVELPNNLYPLPLPA